MATSTQARLGGEYAVRDYDLGELIDDRGDGRTQKLVLTECPICATDPTRPRHHFARSAQRADHFAREHDAGDL
jgi:hypothetical protein